MDNYQVTIQEANMMAETELELWRGFQNVLVTLTEFECTYDPMCEG